MDSVSPDSPFLLSNSDILKLGFCANRVKSNQVWFKITKPER